jgi:hypothetical protein
MALDCFLVVTPMALTTSGSFGWAMATRFWTSTCAVSGSVPILNVTVMRSEPSFVACDSMYSMFSTPFTCSSMGEATVAATVSAVAPG